MSNNDVKVLLKREQCFKVILSTKTEVQCDRDEIQRVIEGIKTGSIIKLKQGLINPSFIVAIVEDEKRRMEFVEQVNTITRHNHQDAEYHGGKDQRALPSGIKSLNDIFASSQLRSLPKAPENKRLTQGEND